MIGLRIVPWCTLEFPFGEPQLFSRTVRSIGIEEAVVADERGEAIGGVASNEVDHESTI